MRHPAEQPARQLRSSALRFAATCASWGAENWGAAVKSSPLLQLPAAEATLAGHGVRIEPLDDQHGVAARARLEAILLLAREPLGSRKLSQYANLADATAARTLIRQLNEQYDRRGSALRIVELAGGYRLLTRPQLASWLRRLAQAPSEVRLSAPSLETLAVIAYRQPVGRADIEAIRGVNCGEIIRQLMDRDLVKIGERSNELGRPYLYATTKHFLEIFGLPGLEDLPRAEVVRSAVLPPPADHESRVISTATNDQRSEEEDDVSVTTLAERSLEEELRRKQAARLPTKPVSAEDDDDDFDDEDDDDLDDDDDDDLDDDEDDLDDDEDDDLDDEDDLDEEEWEEVDDDDELDDEDDEEEDDDWDDDDEEDDDEDDWEDDEE